MKNKLVLLLTGCLVWLMSSCLGSDDYDSELSNNCQITSFVLKNDSVAGLSNVTFTIDQLSERIFNIDSMAYDTEIEKVVCTVGFATGVYQVQVVQEATGDTINWNTTDSLDFSKPVKFITYSASGQFKKVYEAQVNIHQVVPDSMIWSLYVEKVTGQYMDAEKVLALKFNDTDYYYMYAKPKYEKEYQLYISEASDVKNWKQLPLTGLPENEINLLQITQYEGALYAPGTKGIVYKSENGQDWTPMSNTPTVKYILGAIGYGGVNQQSALATIIDNGGVLNFSSMDENGDWHLGDYVPGEFPVTAFSAANHSVMYKERLTIACGRDRQNNLLNSVWATMDGVSWAVLTDEQTNKLPAAEGVMLSYYDDKFFLIGGLDKWGDGTKTIYNSKDNGVSWSRTDTMVVLPDHFDRRGFGNVLVDKDQYMLIIGGQITDALPMEDQIWRGRINRLGFKKD